MTNDTTRTRAPDRGKDLDLQFLFWEREAEIGMAAIEAKGGGRTGPKIDANPLVTRRIVRGARERAEELARMGTGRQKRGDSIETAAEKLNRVTRAWEQVPTEAQDILFHAYGRRQMDPAYERKESKNGAVIDDRLGRWSRVLPLTSAMRDAYEAAAPKKAEVKMITRPERVLAGFTSSEEPAAAEPKQKKRDVIAAERFCVRAPEREVMTIGDWIDNLLHAKNPPKGLRGLFEAARSEAERMVTEAWLVWNDVRMQTAPRRPRKANAQNPNAPNVPHTPYVREERTRDYTWHAEPMQGGEAPPKRARRAVVERGELR